jgi:ubiquinone/menaquinone biosynthesis C-methylase UbiE
MARTIDPERRQRDYYASTAEQYERIHHAGSSEHDVAVAHIASLARELSAKSILDVGAGTGKQVRVLIDRLPGVRVAGIEPVDALIEVGRATHDLSSEQLMRGDALALPFDDGSFDFVMETGVLHHIRESRRAIGEMLRVARLGVFLSDSNRFGQGSLVARLTKVGLYATGLWQAYYLARTRGRGFEESEGDGVYYSFSIYDAMPMLTRWADRVWVVPTRQAASRGVLEAWVGPLLSAPHGLVCALRDSPGADGCGPVSGA